MKRRVVQRGASGEPVAAVGMAVELSHSLSQNLRSHRLTQRIDMVKRAAGVGHWVQERGKDRASWNQPLRELFGLAPGDPVPTGSELIQNFVHEADRDSVRAVFRDWLHSGQGALEQGVRIVRTDGNVRQVHGQAWIESDGDTRWIFGVTVDVTEQRSAELALRSAQERVALAARGVGVGTWEFDLQSGERYWDEQMWVLRGLPPRAAAPSDAQRLAMLHPDDRQSMDETMQHASRTGATLELEFRVVWPDGQVRWLASRSTQTEAQPGRGARRIGVNWDITESRSAADARREREVALRESQAKSMLLARMSHELRTPLNAVLGFAQLLLAREAGNDSASALRQRQLNHIHDAGQNLLSLINDVLALTGAEGGEIPVDLKPVSLKPLLADTLPLVHPLLEVHGVVLQQGQTDFAVMADPTRLRQVLLNLLSNAIKYNRPHGQVQIEAEAHESRVKVRVSDTGRGLTEEQMLHLFEPFNRLGVEPGSVQGSGIGLCIVKSLTERMGGSISVHSTPGVGSVFELSLPAAPRVASSLPVPPPAVDAAGASMPLARRRRVLYIEDNAVNALILTEFLSQRDDLSLHLGVDAAEGVALARELKPDLVLLDMQLPDADGYEVLRRLRAHPETAAIPCVAVSANAMAPDIARALQAGMADYWTKPLDFKAFNLAFNKLLGL